MARYNSRGVKRKSDYSDIVYDLFAFAIREGFHVELANKIGIAQITILRYVKARDAGLSFDTSEFPASWGKVIDYVKKTIMGVGV